MTTFIFEFICTLVGMIIGTVIGFAIGVLKHGKQIGIIYIGEQNGTPITWINTDFTIDQLSKYETATVGIKDVRGR